MVEIRRPLNHTAFAAVRTQRKLKIKDIAAQVGWHPGTLYNLLNRSRNGEPVRISVIAALAWALRIDIEEIIASEPITHLP
jgi:hypothetical protein